MENTNGPLVTHQAATAPSTATVTDSNTISAARTPAVVALSSN